MGLLTHNDLTIPGHRRLALLDMIAVDHGFLRVFWTARHRVSDEMWRSNQPWPFQIRQAAESGIRTIINLRGSRACGSYALEAEACARYGVALVDLGTRSRGAPERSFVLEADDIFRRIAYPALMHCKSGADRAGFMSALYLVLRKNEPVERAMRHLSWRYGHVRQAKTGILDFFLEQYLDYTRARPMPFLTWVKEVYDPEQVARDFHAQWWANLVVDRMLGRE